VAVLVLTAAQAVPVVVAVAADMLVAQAVQEHQVKDLTVVTEPLPLPQVVHQVEAAAQDH
jgi:hypothetical protein